MLYPASVIRVVVSHRMDELLSALADTMATERAARGPLAPLDIVVPNRNLETFLRQRVSETLGIAANLRTVFLRTYLREVAGEGPVLDASLMQGRLLALFHDQRLLGQADLAPVRRYLDSGGPDEDSRDLRRVELSLRLAHLFDEYSTSRTEMLKRWRAEDASPSDGEERWQRVLWRSVCGEDQPSLPLPAPHPGVKYSLLEERVMEAAAATEPTPLHIFGLSYMAPAYHRMLEVLARRRTVHVYALVPCRESAQSLRTKPVGTHNDPYGLCDGNTAVALWGRPSRENLRLLLAQPGSELVPLPFASSPRTSVLARFQHHLVHGTRPTDPPAPLDDSLRIFACPSPRREVEVAAAEIWRLLKQDPSLRVSDILVVVPDGKKDSYFAHVPSVFQESGKLPHSLSDLSAVENHPVAHAIRMLLGLPFAPPTRKALLPLLGHPCLLARFPEVEPAHLPHLLASLGIAREADGQDFPRGYLHTDVFSFDQGLRRLTVGAFFRDEEPVALGDRIVVPAAYDSDRAGYAALGILCRSLLADAAFAKGTNGPAARPLRQWLDFIAGMVNGYLVVDDADPAGQALRARFLSELADLDERGLGDTPVRFRVAARLAEECLRKVPWGRGHYLATGVTVASFVPMRSIPFRAVFILGLSQGDFPRPARRGELDLRRQERLPGDVDDAEQDLHLFLETLLSAKDCLRLSYVARDEVTGDPLPPSKVVQDLRGLLADGLVAPADLPTLFQDDAATRPPLRRHEDDERRHALRSAQGEFQARLEGLRIPGPGTARERIDRLPEPERDRLAHVLGLAPRSPARPRPTDGIVPVTLDDLFRFLVDPLQGGARFALRMRRLWDDGEADVEDEPLDVRASHVLATMARAFEKTVLIARGMPAPEALRAAFHAEATVESLRGRVPTNLLGHTFFEAGEQYLQALTEQIADPPPHSCRRFRLSAGAGTPARPHLPTIAIPLATGGQAELMGELSLLFAYGDGLRASLQMVRTKPPSKGNPGPEDLRAFLDHLALSANGEAGPHTSMVAFVDEKVRLTKQSFRPVDAAAAHGHLARMVEALLSDDGGAPGIHPYVFPFQAVLAQRERNRPFAEVIEQLIENDRESEYPTLATGKDGVPFALTRYPIPDEETARAMAEDRFGAFFALLEEAAP